MKNENRVRGGEHRVRQIGDARRAGAHGTGVRGIAGAGGGAEPPVSPTMLRGVNSAIPLMLFDDKLSSLIAGARVEVGSLNAMFPSYRWESDGGAAAVVVELDNVPAPPEVSAISQGSLAGRAPAAQTTFGSAGGSTHAVASATTMRGGGWLLRGAPKWGEPRHSPRSGMF